MAPYSSRKPTTPPTGAPGVFGNRRGKPKPVPPSGKSQFRPGTAPSTTAISVRKLPTATAGGNRRQTMPNRLRGIVAKAQEPVPRRGIAHVGGSGTRAAPIRPQTSARMARKMKAAANNPSYAVLRQSSAHPGQARSTGGQRVNHKAPPGQGTTVNEKKISGYLTKFDQMNYTYKHDIKSLTIRVMRANTNNTIKTNANEEYSELINKMLNNNVLSGVTYLEIVNCGLTWLNLDKLTNLRKCYITNNHLKNLPSFGDSMQFLYASKNMLTTIRLDNLKNLKKLVVSYNQISTLPDVIPTLTLTYLDVSYNKIYWLPSKLFEGQIITLVASGNLIEVIPHMKPPLDRFFFNINKNPLKEIHKSFIGNELDKYQLMRTMNKSVFEIPPGMNMEQRSNRIKNPEIISKLKENGERIAGVKKMLEKSNLGTNMVAIINKMVKDMMLVEPKTYDE